MLHWSQGRARTISFPAMHGAERTTFEVWKLAVDQLLKNMNFLRHNFKTTDISTELFKRFYKGTLRHQGLFPKPLANSSCSVSNNSIFTAS